MRAIGGKGDCCNPARLPRTGGGRRYQPMWGEQHLMSRGQSLTLRLSAGLFLWVATLPGHHALRAEPQQPPTPVGSPHFGPARVGSAGVGADGVGADGAPRSTSAPKQTMGGQQFWTDLLLFRGWRIQQHALTKRCRLLDERNRRWESGDFQTCASRLDDLKRSLGLRRMGGKAVILLHGLADTRWVMSELESHLQQQGGHEHVLNMSYASTRDHVEAHSEALASVIQGLDGVSQLDLVGYSLGAIVIRHYAKRGDVDRRISRVVMLGPPNKGAHLASHFGKGNKLFAWVAGASAVELGTEWDKIAKDLGTPPGAFGIIAGAVARRGIDNPLIDGDDDMIVAVNETLLAGADDFAVLPFTHTELPKKEQVWTLVDRFLENGYFRTAERRRPIIKRETSE